MSEGEQYVNVATACVAKNLSVDTTLCVANLQMITDRSSIDKVGSMENILKKVELDLKQQQTYEQMAATYPLIYRAYLHPEQYPTYPIAERKFECGLGWYDIIDELSAWLEGQAEFFQRSGSRKIPLVAQCKEKFGSLRYYVFELPDNQTFRAELIIRKEKAYQRSCCTSEI